MIDLTKFKNQDHSPLSASGSERWLECPGSVKLSLDVPEPPANKWALEGTLAHEYLEEWLHYLLLFVSGLTVSDFKSKDMYKAVKTCVDMVNAKIKLGFNLTPEQKIPLTHIHESMFGTADITLIKEDILDVWDYKHGAGKVVELVDNNGRINTQLAYYALGVAHKHNYKFNKVRIGIVQPRAKHADGPIRSLVINIKQLKMYNDIFSRGVDRVFSKNPALNVGPWCHWCNAKDVCPKQQKIKSNKLEWGSL